MRRGLHSKLPSLALCSVVLATGCKDDAPSPAEATPPPVAPSQDPEAPPAPSPEPKAELPDEGPLPQLRTGMREPTRLPSVEATLVAHATDGAHYYELAMPGIADTDSPVRVHIDEPLHAVPAIARERGEVHVMVRVPAGSGPAPTTLRGTVFLAGDRPEGRTWLALPFTTTGSGTGPTTGLARRWADAFGRDLRGEQRPYWARQASHPWREFAAGRVIASTHGWGSSPGVGVDTGSRPRRTDLSRLMHTTTAATSMQEALQHDRGLRLRSEDGPAIVPIGDLKPPTLAEHPWDPMMAALPDPSAGTPEPLAKAVPAEFWYVRFDDIRVMLRVIDEADAWGTPVAHIMEERAEVRDLATRYQRQLGLRRSGLAKVMGHTVVERVAIAGSDPYLRDGSDVSFVFELSTASVFETELDRHMSEYRTEVPGIVESTYAHGDHTITLHRDPTGTVRQHRARVGDLAVVSNSETACRAMLDAIDGKRRRLSDEPDLAYMLARDPGAHDGFAFLGDRFIAQVVGPQQKILAARRQQALADLLTPGYAALLYGWLEGKAPADTEALIAANLLHRDELRHADGGLIAFEPGQGARSSWGSPDALTPLLDQPAPALVTDAERRAYDTFARVYQDYWREFIDPVAIRFDLEDEGDQDRAIVDVRVLPLISGSDYGELEEIVGTERIEVPAIDDGLQMVWAVGADSKVRRDLDRAASVLSSKKDIGLGWLGDWVMVGTLDRRALVDMLALVDDSVQMPASKDPSAAPSRKTKDLQMARAAGTLPVYAAAHVRNPATLIATLTGIRTTLNEVAPGMVTWGEHSRHRDYPIVRVGVDPKAPGEFSDFAEAIALYYAQVDDVFVIGVDPDALGVVIDRVTDEHTPRRGVEGGPQFVMDARLAEGRASWVATSWALQGQANRTQGAARSTAEILLRGDPSITSPAQLTERGMAYFGAYPVSASGRPDFSLGPHGASDGVHGSEIAPAFPELPVEQSPIDALMQRLVGVRASVAFDREPAKMDPPARSLHTRLELTLGEARD